jgi:hypothetical protein
MADAVGRVCFCFGFGSVGLDDVIINVDVGNPLSSLVKSNSIGSLLIMTTLLFREGQPRHALLSSCCLWHRTAWCTIFVHGIRFQKIQPESLPVEGVGQ